METERDACLDDAGQYPSKARNGAPISSGIESVGGVEEEEEEEEEEGEGRGRIHRIEYR